ELAALVLNYQLTGRLPAEVPCASATRRDTSFARVLAALDGDQPVPLHHVIAALVKAGRLQAIITPNVDRALEAACAAIGATLEVVSGDEAFAAMASQVRETGGAPAAGCRLLRIYGCADEPGSLAATFSMLETGLPPDTADCTRHLLTAGPWLVVGCTGAEFEGQPNYLYLRSDADDAIGLTWLLPAGAPPLPEVTALTELYGERGHIAAGDAAETLRGLLAGAEDTSTTADAGNLDELRADAARRVEQAVQEWASAASVPMLATLMADMLVAAGQREAAVKLLTTAREATSEDAHKEHGYSQCCSLLAHLLADTEERRRAVDLYKEALTLDEQLGDPTRRGRILCEVADLALARGEDKDAVVLLKEALAVFEKLGDEHGRARSLNQMGVVARQNEELDRAMRRYTAALEIREAQRDVFGVGETMINMASVHRSRNEDERALTLYTEGLRIMDRLNAVKPAAMARYYTGLLLRRYPERADEALQHLRLAYDLFKKTGSKNIDRARKQITILINDYADRAQKMVNESKDSDGLRDALELYEKAFEASDQLGELDTAARIKSNMGMVEYTRRGKIEAALQHFRVAWEMFRQTGSSAAERIRKYITGCEKKLEGTKKMISERSQKVEGGA
ncbi:MAG: tetratricopeptide repeat protein, partial [Planctomycetota bacterium]